MRPLSARIDVDEIRLADEEEDAGRADEDGLWSRVTWTSEPEVFGAPQEAQKRADWATLLPHCGQ